MSKPMTKTQLVAALADAMGADKKTANAALDALVAVVTREVADGGTVTLPGAACAPFSIRIRSPCPDNVATLGSSAGKMVSSLRPSTLV